MLRLTNVVAVILIIAALLLTLAGYMQLYLNKAGPSTNKIITILNRGGSLKEFVNELSSQHVIKQPKLFYLMLRLIRLSNNIKAGEYEFHAAITPKQILAILLNGKSVIRRLTVVEGLTVKQITDKVNADKVLEGEISSNVTEGYLLPDTYFYSYGDTRQSLIDRMHKKMEQTLDELWANRAVDLPFNTKEEALTLASIIEKETAKSSERKMIAGVFINRLKKNMKLQADPTTIYAITKGQMLLQRELTKKDLLTQSPFNTYFTQGLPPHPISNPGREAIEAVLNPADTKNLFFVANGIGGHHFSDNLKQHNKHVENYRARTLIRR